MPVSFTFSSLEASGLWNILDGSWRLHRFPIRCVWDASTKQPEPMASGPYFSGTASWNSQGLLSNSIWPPQWISTAAPASLSCETPRILRIALGFLPRLHWVDETVMHCQHLQKILGDGGKWAWYSAQSLLEAPVLCTCHDIQKLWNPMATGDDFKIQKHGPGALKQRSVTFFSPSDHEPMWRKALKKIRQDDDKRKPRFQWPMPLSCAYENLWVPKGLTYIQRILMPWLLWVARRC